MLEALVAWGLKYERHPLAPEEAAHAEHLIPGLTVALNELAPKPTGRRLWRFDFNDPQTYFALAFDGRLWSVTENGERPDGVVSTTARAWAEFVTRPPATRRLPSREIQLSGDADRVAEFIDVFQAGHAARAQVRGE